MKNASWRPIYSAWVSVIGYKEYVEESVLIFYYFRIIKVICILEIVKNKATYETIAGVWWVSTILFKWFAKKVPG